MIRNRIKQHILLDFNTTNSLPRNFFIWERCHGLVGPDLCKTKAALDLSRQQQQQQRITSSISRHA
jgi:hypothetical protein